MLCLDNITMSFAIAQNRGVGIEANYIWLTNSVFFGLSSDGHMSGGKIVLKIYLLFLQAFPNSEVEFSTGQNRITFYSHPHDRTAPLYETYSKEMFQKLGMSFFAVIKKCCYKRKFYSTYFFSFCLTRKQLNP